MSTASCEQNCQLSQCASNKITAHQCFTDCKGPIGDNCMQNYAANHIAIPNKLNTSNKGKLAEFQELFKLNKHEITNTTFDLAEIDSDALSVIIQKASAVNNKLGGVIVEDTSLDIEGEDVGVNIRWLLDNLNQFAGKKASWTVMLAFREDNTVFVTQGVVQGTIVTKQGSEGFGFDPYFLPIGANKTLAQDKPHSVNARAFAVDAMIKKDFFAIKPAIDKWDGKWQEDH